MAKETLNRIRETELKAKQQLQDAKVSGEKLLEDARNEVKKYKEDLLTDVRADAKKALDEILNGQDRAMEAAEVRARAVVDQMSRNLKGKEEEACRLVISHII